MKNRFLANLFSLLSGLLLTGSFTFANIFFGFFLSYFLLFVITRGTVEGEVF